jgi:Ser-tRNA(Ala) deacylase AlaX
MTIERFRDDATLTRCDARVVSHDERGIVLDRTVCYLQGGGQAGDAGWLSTAHGRARMRCHRATLSPAGGPRVANTAGVGAAVVTKAEKKSATTRRVVQGFAP